MTKSVVLVTKFGYDPMNCGRVIDRLTEEEETSAQKNTKQAGGTVLQ